MFTDDGIEWDKPLMVKPEHMTMHMSLIENTRKIFEDLNKFRSTKKKGDECGKRIKKMSILWR